MQTHRHQADILIIGGGVCGRNAALTAREQGRSVIVMDKASLTQRTHRRHRPFPRLHGHRRGMGHRSLPRIHRQKRLTNIDVVDSGTVRTPTRSSVRRNQLHLRQPDGTYCRTKSYRQPGRGGSTSTARG
ncbi:MAG: FAD-binding protein [Bilophila wadsworthia]